MNFLEALQMAVEVIREQADLDEIYLYESSSQTQLYLKDCEGSLQFTLDVSLSSQIYLAACFDKRLESTTLNLNMIFSKDWEVRLRKTELLRAKKNYASKTSEPFIDYAPVGKEEV